VQCHCQCKQPLYSTVTPRSLTRMRILGSPEDQRLVVRVVPVVAPRPPREHLPEVHNQARCGAACAGRGGEARGGPKGGVGTCIELEGHGQVGSAS